MDLVIKIVLLSGYFRGRECHILFVFRTKPVKSHSYSLLSAFMLEKSSYFVNVTTIQYIFVFIINTYYNTQN